MTRRYAKFLPDAKKKAAERAAELLEQQAQASSEDEADSEVTDSLS
jgi:hypothetical protein